MGKEALIRHLKNLHKVELAKESPACRKEMLRCSESNGKPAAPKTLKPTKPLANEEKRFWTAPPGPANHLNKPRVQIDTPRSPLKTYKDLIGAEKVNEKVKQIAMMKEINAAFVEIKEEMMNHRPGLEDDTQAEEKLNENSTETPLREKVKEDVGPNNVAISLQPNLNENLEIPEAYGEIISGDLEENSSDTKNDKTEVDLMCKLCCTYFTYTAPDQEELRDHYATIHKGEVISG